MLEKVFHLKGKPIYLTKVLGYKTPPYVADTFYINKNVTARNYDTASAFDINKKVISK